VSGHQRARRTADFDFFFVILVEDALSMYFRPGNLGSSWLLLRTSLANSFMMSCSCGKDEARKRKRKRFLLFVCLFPTLCNNVDLPRSEPALET
jgi:hypothetical protein